MLRIFIFILLFGSLISCSNSELNTAAHFQNGFEESSGFNEIEGVQSAEVHSGKFALEMKPEREWGPSFQKKFSLLPVTEPKGILVSIWVKSDVKMPKALLVIQVDTAGVNKFWDGKELGQQIFEAGSWQLFQVKQELGSFSPDDEIKVFVWNKDKEHIFLDDWEIQFMR